jgi:hypothetical protein
MEVEMKMVKSLLLGTAAGLVAVAGAQAADMPVKAKPVQYVKICSLYGDGFYYIPGTDVCLKVGGYVRGEYFYNYGVNGTNGPWQAGTAGTGSGYNDRFDGGDFILRTRAYAWFDSRQQTEYGTLRTYLNVGVNYDNPTNTSTTFNANRAFIQFAGFTIGTAQSFFDFYSSPASSFFAPPSSDTGDGGWKVLAYTAQFGNGFSSTVSLEEPRSYGTASPSSGVFNTNLGNGFVLGTTPAANTDKAKVRFPDIVSNWRVDQAWGSAQIMMAAHDVSAGYYAATAGAVSSCIGAAASFAPIAAAGTMTGSEICGHPADKVGWAAGAGIKLNGYGGDYFQIQGTYAQGATRYVSFTPAGAFSPVSFSGASMAYGFFSDGIFNAATGEVQLTTATGVNAAYDHFWLPNLRTSLYGFLGAFRYGNQANAAICNMQTQAAAGAITFAGAVPAVTPGLASGISGIAACNNNFNWWGVGSRTQWNITPWWYVGFDLFYQKLETASNGAIVLYTAAAGTAKPTALYSISNQDNLAFRVRFHRDIIP